MTVPKKVLKITGENKSKAKQCSFNTRQLETAKKTNSKLNKTDLKSKNRWIPPPGRSSPALIKVFDSSKDEPYSEISSMRSKSPTHLCRSFSFPESQHETRRNRSVSPSCDFLHENSVHNQIVRDPMTEIKGCTGSLNNIQSSLDNEIRQVLAKLREIMYDKRNLDYIDIRDLESVNNVIERRFLELNDLLKHLHYLIDEFRFHSHTQSTSETNYLNDQLRNLTNKYNKLKLQLEQLNNECLKSSSAQNNLESIKSHLQNQLRLKEGECDRLAVRIRELETRLNGANAEMSRARSDGEIETNQLRGEYETMKRVARAHKKRADRLESTLSGTMARLADSSASLTHVQPNLIDPNISRRESLTTLRQVPLISEIDRKSSLNQMAELESVQDAKNQSSQLKQLKEKIEDIEKKFREQIMHSNQFGLGTNASGIMMSGMNPWMMAGAHANMGSSSATGGAFDYLKEENEKLRDAALKNDNKCLALERDANELKASLASCEKVIAELKSTASEEIGRFKHQQEQIDNLEKDKKVLTKQLDEIKERNNMRQKNQQAAVLAATLGIDSDGANMTASSMGHGLGSIVDIPTALGGTQVSFGNGLTRSLSHSNMNEQNKKRIQELESTTAELRKDLIKMRKERAEIERRSNTRLSELRLQLNQADATNRSLQSYLTFLKRSYTSVFQGSSSTNQENILDSKILVGTTDTGKRLSMH